MNGNTSINGRKLSWEDAQTFLAVAETGSFSSAAQLLALGQPTVSRRIANLETKLSQQLFTRGKQGAQLTAVAEQLLPIASQMAKWATEFEQVAQNLTDGAEGLVRIACPPGVAVEQIAPFAGWLAQHEPGIRLEVLAAIDFVDLSRGVADIAIRTQKPREPELVVLREVASQQGIYGAPDYVGGLDQPVTWQDLKWVTWSDRYREVAPRPMLEKLIPEFTPSLSSDDYLVQKAAVKAGLGVMICDAPEASDSPSLVEVDVGVALPPVKFYLVCTRSMRNVSLITRVADLLVEKLAVNKSGQ